MTIAKLECRWPDSAIAQDANAGEVLMMAWMNEEALQQHCRKAHRLLVSLSNVCGAKVKLRGHPAPHCRATDCDGDTLLLQVDQVVVAPAIQAAALFSYGPAMGLDARGH